ncbi:hypothetical protein T05_5663 [Trichinella murrelli]|uniref:Uncharacterized protein n=1 Tax=Trichinella murrelli TaxID=144512 RepID=A0A0V0U0E4_9BILA|nr:hypothetical protein T05_5663 [Trichinella murrelli]
MRSNAVEVVFADCNEKKQSNLFTRIFMQIFIRGLDWYLGFEKSIIIKGCNTFRLLSVRFLPFTSTNNNT